MRPVNVFVAAGGNAFMTDIAGWIVEAARLAGRSATLERQRLPVAGEALNLVLAPHEFFALSGATDRELATSIAASVPICTEQPGTAWFNLTAGLIEGAATVLDINTHGVDALRERGHDAIHLRLGGVPSMRAPDVVRDRDVVFLGASTARRAARLASLAPLLWDRRSELRLFRFSAPVDQQVPGVVFGTDKYALLARSRILLNLHRDDVVPGYFEWARMVEAMANGCAVLTEPSTGFWPLVDGKHFVTATDLGRELVTLLDDPDACAELGEAARSAVLDEYPLVDSLRPVLERLDELSPAVATRRRRRKPIARTHRPPLFAELRPVEALRERVYTAFIDEQRLLRAIERARCRIRHGAEDVVIRSETPAYAAATPDVSVIVTLYNYAGVVTETLDSIVASTDVNLELVVVDDHSGDGSREAVERFMAAHPELPMRLLASEINRGLSPSRNLAVAEARAPLVMIMDADNTIYPTCLRRLADALGADPAAAFAYTTLEAFGAEPGLRSEMAWFVPWLCESNYIDAQAMVRRSTFDRHGGYVDADDGSYGWEDWGLWLRLAAAGEHGVHVPEMLGRYRTQTTSMVAITNLVAGSMRARVRAHHAGLPWPERVVGNAVG
jgi:hypothetical protein